ncbi:COG1470 family protein [Streptomyces sp. 3N207]|uniref:COG1470 family protein n=1 Tax=Streptomyces sp. 3N207 TaxID=3457417 RepID=UPI003FD12AF7
MVGRTPPHHGAGIAPTPRTRGVLPGRTRGVLVCALVVFCLLGAGNLAASAPPGKGEPPWSAAPSPPAGTATADARSYFYLEGDPGTVLKDSLALTNESDAPRTFRLRGADAYNARGGGFAVRDEGRSRGPGSWIALAEDTVEVPPHTRAEVPLSVTVPDSAVPGDHPAAVVISDGRRRVGIRMHLRVSGPTLAALSVENVRVEEADDGAAAIGYTLVNRGNTALRPRLAVDVDGLFGPLIRQPARALPVELLPGQRVTRQERWPHPPAADMADVRLTVTAEDGARDSGTASYTAVPWGWVVGVLVALGGTGIAWYAHRRRGASPGEDRRPNPGEGALSDRGRGGEAPATDPADPASNHDGKAPAVGATAATPMPGAMRGAAK